MGWYYGFKLKAKISGGAQVDRLLRMFCNLSQDDQLFFTVDFPNELFFKESNWRDIFYVFNEFKEYKDGILTISCSTKRKKCAIKHFCDWIEPFIDEILVENLSNNGSDEVVEWEFNKNKFSFDCDDFFCTCDEPNTKKYIPIENIKEYIDGEFSAINCKLSDIFRRHMKKSQIEVFNDLPNDFQVKIKEQIQSLVKKTHSDLINRIDLNFERMFREDIEKAKGKFVDECIEKYKRTPKFKKIFLDELQRVSGIFSNTVDKANSHISYLEKRLDEIERKVKFDLKRG